MDLKPCPFCGWHNNADANDGRCDNCDATAHFLEAWNTRPIEDALLARAVEAERKLAVAANALGDIEADAIAVRKAIDQSPVPKRHTPAVLDRIINRKRVALREIGGE